MFNKHVDKCLNTIEPQPTANEKQTQKRSDQSNLRNNSKNQQSSSLKSFLKKEWSYENDNLIDHDKCNFRSIMLHFYEKFESY